MIKNPHVHYDDLAYKLLTICSQPIPLMSMEIYIEQEAHNLTISHPSKELKHSSVMWAPLTEVGLRMLTL